ncbi:unnamed protein product, partial [Staurois parvus]
GRSKASGLQTFQTKGQFTVLQTFGGRTIATSVRRNIALGLVVSCIMPVIIRRRNSAPSLVLLGGIVPHHWYYWGE